MPDSLNTDEDWAKLITWLQANGLRIYIPLKGPAILFKKSPV